MNRKFLFIVFAVALSAIMTVIPGCTGSRVSLVDQEVVSIKAKSSKNVRILWTDVYQDGEDIIVYGVVRRCSHTSYPLETHVDIKVFNTDGKLLHEARTPDTYVPRCATGKGIHWKRFKLRVPEIPRNSRVQAVAHSGPHEI